MFEMPTQKQIDAAVYRAHEERAQVMRDGFIWVGEQIAAPIRTALRRRS